jgi:Kef-type K+ transport system membrane component KefB
MVQEVLLSISLIIAVAALLTIIARFIKQPPIIAYLFAGIIVGPLFFNLISPSSTSMLSLFAHIGVAFLLFIVGLSLDLRLLKEVGKVSSMAGILEVLLTASGVFVISIGLGFNNIVAIYLGSALAFSSTVVVVKILSDKKEIDTLHGRIALGILIVEDFVATIVLMAIPLIKSGGSYLLILQDLGIAIMIIIFIFLFAGLVLNRFLNYLARSQEALFLFGIAWVMVLATLFDSLGFSIEVGALIAGMSLASSKYNLDLGGKMKPLRDFFVVLFFVYFGSQLTGPITGAMLKQALIFSAFIFLGKPIIVMSVLRLFGYRRRTNFFAGSSLAQVSEFSLILILMGFNLGILSSQILSLAILVSVITIGLSSYSIYYSGWLFGKISKLLKIFEKEDYLKQDREKPFDVLLLGYHRIGYKVLQELKEMKISFAVVDYNPKVILSLGKQGIGAIYGDAGDREFLNEIGVDKAKLIISTIPDENANISIKEKLKDIGSDAIFIATTEQPRNALGLYDEGIDYVLIPHHLGGKHIADMIKKFSFRKDKYKEEGKKQARDLKSARDKSGFE